MTTLRPLGCLPTPRSEQCHGPACTSGLLSAARIPATLFQPTGYVLDQRQQDCVANAVEDAKVDRQVLRSLSEGEAIFVAEPTYEGPLRADAVELGSRRWGYLGARMVGHSVSEDRGCRVGDYVAWQGTDGCPLERYWPYPEGTAYALPGLDAERHAIDQRGSLKAHRASTLAELQRGVLGNATAVVGCMVDEELMEYTSGVWSFSGRVVGAHAFRIVGWEPGFAWAKNSWGDAYGEPYPGPRHPRATSHLMYGRAGFFRIDYATLVDPAATFEMWLVDHVSTATETTTENSVTRSST